MHCAAYRGLVCVHSSLAGVSSLNYHQEKKNKKKIVTSSPPTLPPKKKKNNWKTTGKNIWVKEGRLSSPLKDACLIWIFCLPCELGEYSGKQMLRLARLVHLKGIGLEALSGALESQLELLFPASFPSPFKAEWLYGTCQLTSEWLGSINAGTWGSSASFPLIWAILTPPKHKSSTLALARHWFCLNPVPCAWFGRVLTDRKGAALFNDLLTSDVWKEL